MAEDEKDVVTRKYRDGITCYSCGKVIVNPEYERDFREVMVGAPEGDEAAKLVPYCLFCFEKWKKEKEKPK